MVSRLELGIVGSDEGEAAARLERPVERVEAAAAVGLDLGAVLGDLDGVGSLEGERVGLGQPRPFGVDDGDEGAGAARAGGELRPRSWPSTGTIRGEREG